MSQHDGVISDQAGAPFLSDLNSALAAQRSQNSGGTSPESPVAYMPWADTAASLYKMRNAANNGWLDGFSLENFGMPAVQKQLATAYTTTGTSTAYILAPTPAISANVAGLRFRAYFHDTPGAAPTMAVSGQPALPLKYKDYTGTKQAITPTQVPANWKGDVECDGVDWVLVDIPSIELPYSAPHAMALITASGNYVVPAGVYRMFVALVGGGGGGSGAVDTNYSPYWGSTGGTTSFGGLTATGGGGGRFYTSGPAGVGSGGQFHGAGNSLSLPQFVGSLFGKGGAGGAMNNGQTGSTGAYGGLACGWIDVTPGQNITATVGAGGAGSAVWSTGATGNAGAIALSW